MKQHHFDQALHNTLIITGETQFDQWHRYQNDPIYHEFINHLAHLYKEIEQHRPKELMFRHDYLGTFVTVEDIGKERVMEEFHVSLRAPSLGKSEDLSTFQPNRKKEDT